jgi:hypothetical protein
VNPELREEMAEESDDFYDPGDIDDEEEFYQKRYADILDLDWRTYTAYKGLSRNLQFPAPSDISINMMPFIAAEGLPTLPQVQFEFNSRLFNC